MKSKSRHPAIRHEALSERAQNYLAQRKKALARKDMERIYAEDSTYPGLAEALAGVGDGEHPTAGEANDPDGHAVVASDLS